MKDGIRRGMDQTQQVLPSKELAWLHYRASAAPGLVVWLVTAANAKQVHSPQICLAMVERYVADFAELDTPAALDAIATSASSRGIESNYSIRHL